MTGPWEKYQPQDAGDGPWRKYQEGKEAPKAPVAPQTGRKQDMVAFTGSNVGLGLASLAGMPVDAAGDVVDLAKAGAGYVQSKITGKPPEDWSQPTDRSKVPGTGQWFADRMRAHSLITPDAQPTSKLQEYAARGLQFAPSALAGRGVPAEMARGAGGAFVAGLASKGMEDATGGGQVAGTAGSYVPAAIAAAAGGRRVPVAHPSMEEPIPQRPQQSNLASRAIPFAKVVDPEVLALAKKAKSFGIDLRPDMLTDNKFARIFGQAMEQVPLSGSKEKDRLLAFNRALVDQIGGDTKAGRLTPEVFKKALQKSGTEIGGFYKKSKIDAMQLSSSLSKLEQEVGAETADNASIINFYLGQAKKLAAEQNPSGIALRKLDSKIGSRIRGATDGDLREGLSGIQEALRDSLNAGLSAEDRAALADARARYAKAITIQPLVAKAKRGLVDPSLLLGRMNSSRAGQARMARGQAGDMGDLARIGSEFLTNPGSSNTAERGAIYGGLGLAGAGAAAANPLYAGGLWGAANLYNRLGPYLIPEKP